MGKDEILQELERTKGRMHDNNNLDLSDMIAITNALIYIVGMMNKEIEEPAKRTKKEPKVKKKIVDYGKIVALSKAGWSQKKIADEMGVSANAICVSLKRYKEKMEDGFVWDPEEKKFIK